MAYQYNKPLATDQLSQSQADIAGNFTAIGTMMDPDAKNLQLPVAGNAPTTPAGDVGFLYSMLVAANPELFWKPRIGGTAVNFTSAGKTNPGWCVLPCGLIVKWGVSANITYGATGTAALANGAGVPNFAAGSPLMCHVSAQTYNSSATDKTGTISLIGCDDGAAHTVTCRAVACFAGGTGTTGVSFSYIAIGI
jgi:hypothetical protein